MMVLKILKSNTVFFNIVELKLLLQFLNPTFALQLLV